MLDQATYTPRLKAEYATKIRAALKAEFGYKNDMQIPRLDKIVLNMGVGEAVKDTKKVNSTACGSCYGAETAALTCCNTCEDVSLLVLLNRNGDRWQSISAAGKHTLALQQS